MKPGTILLLLLSLSLAVIHPSNMQAQNKKTPTEIIYVYDALCGWCYGFSPVMHKVYKKYNNGIDFIVVSGGLVTGERIGPVGEVAPYIKTAYKTVEERTGVTFGDEFLRQLEKGEMVFTSLPAAVAMAVFKMYQPDKAVDFAEALQNAIYFEGMPPEPYEGYAQVASTFGIDAAAFLKKMNMDMLQQQAYADFTIAYDMGVTGFPAVFVRNGKDTYQVAEGYVDYDTLVSRIEEVLTEIKSEAAPDTWYDEH